MPNAFKYCAPRTEKAIRKEEWKFHPSYCSKQMRQLIEWLEKNKDREILAKELRIVMFKGQDRTKNAIYVLISKVVKHLNWRKSPYQLVNIRKHGYRYIKRAPQQAVRKPTKAPRN